MSERPTFENISGYPPPASVEAEGIVISAMLCSTSFARKAKQLLGAYCFTDPPIRAVFKHIAAVIDDGREPTAENLRERFRAKNVSDEIVRWVDKQRGLTAVGCEPHIETLDRLAKQRLMRDIGLELALGGCRREEPDEWSKRLASVSATLRSNLEIETPTPITLRDAAERVADDTANGKAQLISTGIYDVDYAVGGGLAFGEMVVLAARPSHGKTMFAMQILHATTAAGIPSALLRAEMPDEQIGKRAVQFATGIRECDWAARTGEIKRDIASHFARRADYFLVPPTNDVYVICESIRKLNKDNGVRVFAVDYLQLLKARGKTEYEICTEACKCIRQVTTETNAIVIALAQLGREIEGRAKFMPTLRDLKNTGQIEQDADVVLFVVWPWKIDPVLDKSTYQFYVGKVRNREIRRHAVECIFDAERQMVKMFAPEPVSVADDTDWTNQF